MQQKTSTNSSISSCQKMELLAGVLLTVVAGLFVVPEVNAQSFDVVDDDALSRDAAYTGSATIVGLAIFGSLMSIRLRKISSAEPKAKALQRLGVKLIILGCVVLVSIHMLFMGFMCCEDPGNWTMLVAVATILSLVTILIGFVKYLDPSKPL